jgi:hypothetical protein
MNAERVAFRTMMALRSPSGADREVPLHADSYYRRKCTQVLTAIIWEGALTCLTAVIWRECNYVLTAIIWEGALTCLTAVYLAGVQLSVDSYYLGGAALNIDSQIICGLCGHGA